MTDVAKCSEGIAVSGLSGEETLQAGSRFLPERLAVLDRHADRTASGSIVPRNDGSAHTPGPSSWATAAARGGHPVGMRSIIDFYRSNPVLFALVLVVAVLLAMLVLGLGSGSPVQVIALGAVGGLVAGLVIAASRR